MLILYRVTEPIPADIGQEKMHIISYATLKYYTEDAFSMLQLKKVNI